MSDPDSVEFEGIERAARKNALGNSIDTICGFVRDKKRADRNRFSMSSKKTRRTSAVTL